MELNRIYNQDCLKGMRDIPDNSVDMVLCDLPYGTTQFTWDNVIPFDKLWEQYFRVAKENAAFVLTAQQPFATDLINSCRKYFRYEIIWQKTQVMGFLDAKRKPLRTHENILLFYRKLPTYNPQKTTIEKSKQSWGRKRTNSGGFEGYQEFRKPDYVYTEDGTRYPTSVLKISSWNGALFGKTERGVKHPTQKPVDLFRWLIRTYSNPGDVVLDNCMGSGTTAIACIREGRRFVGFETDKKYFDYSIHRIDEEVYKNTIDTKYTLFP